MIRREDFLEGNFPKIYIKASCKLLYNVPLLGTPRQCVITRPDLKGNKKKRQKDAIIIHMPSRNTPSPSSFSLFLGRSNMCVMYLFPSVKYETANSACLLL